MIILRGQITNADLPVGGKGFHGPEERSIGSKRAKVALGFQCADPRGGLRSVIGPECGGGKENEVRLTDLIRERSVEGAVPGIGVMEKYFKNYRLNVLRFQG